MIDSSSFEVFLHTLIFLTQSISFLTFLLVSVSKHEKSLINLASLFLIICFLISLTHYLSGASHDFILRLTVMNYLISLHTSETSSLIERMN